MLGEKGEGDWGGVGVFWDDLKETDIIDWKEYGMKSLFQSKFAYNRYH